MCAIGNDLLIHTIAVVVLVIKESQVCMVFKMYGTK